MNCRDVSIELSKSLNLTVKKSQFSLSKKSLINQSINWIVKTQPICQDFLRVPILLSIYLSSQGYINSQERMKISFSKILLFRINLYLDLDLEWYWYSQLLRPPSLQKTRSRLCEFNNFRFDAITFTFTVHCICFETVATEWAAALCIVYALNFVAINEIGVFCFENEQVFHVL